MSRVGKVPIKLPKGVDVKVSGNSVAVKGPKGELTQKVSEGIKVDVEDGFVRFSVENPTNQTKALWGLYRVLLSNMIDGVSTGYTRNLEIVGVGYRAELKGKSLQLHAGFSHPVIIDPPNGIAFTVPQPTKITITGIDKQVIGQIAADIRRIRPPEPYKGKGVRYANETVRRKAGKTGAK